MGMESLYIGLEKWPDICKSGTPHTGMRGQNGVGLSAHHNGKTTFAKYSEVVPVAYKLVTNKRVGCIKTGDGVYFEGTFDTSEGDKETVFTVNGERTSFFGEGPSRNWQRDVLPMLVMALGSEDTTFDEFKGVYTKFLEAVTAGEKLEEEDLLLFCDSFYYSWIKAFPALNQGEELTAEMIKQLGRTVKNPDYVDVNGAPPMFRRLKISEMKKKAADSGLINQAREGLLRVSYDWDIEQSAQIPSLDELALFVPSEQFEDSLMLIRKQLDSVLTRMDLGIANDQAIGNNAINIIFTGKPGTGKSVTGRALAAALGLPFYCVPVSRNTEEDDFQGKTKIGEDGKFQFAGTPFLTAFKHGGIVMLEEFNLANPAVIMGSLGQAIEKPYVLYEDGYKPVYRHPLCIIIATCNVMTQGAQKANEAFISRCPATFVLNDPEDSEFIKILSSQDESIDVKVVKKVYGTFKKVISYLRDENYEDLTASVTLRHCLGALRLIGAGIPVKRAVKNSIVNVLALESLDIAEEVFDNVVDPMLED